MYIEDHINEISISFFVLLFLFLASYSIFNIINICYIIKKMCKRKRLIVPIELNEY